MSNGLYVKSREKFLRGEIAWHTDDIRLVLVDTLDYTVNLITHEFLSDIPVAGRVSISDLLTNKTTVNGWAGTSSNIVFENVFGDSCEAMIVFKDTGSPTTSPLLAYFDNGITNLPITPNGARITFIVDNANGLFQI